MNTRDLDLNLLFVFEAIYSTGNISKAARQLGLSQPAVSNALTRLRKQLDDQLFVREGNGVVPTSRAEGMIEPVRTALNTIQASIGPVESFDPKKTKKHFRLIVADPLEPLVMPNLLRYTETNDQLTFELLPPQSVNIEEALLQDKVDLAVFLMPGRVSEILSKSLFPVDLVLIARKDHPRINGSINAQQMAQENYVSLQMAPGKLENSGKVTVWQKLQQRVSCHVYKVSSIAQIAANTELLGFVPRAYAEHISHHCPIQILELDTPFSNQQFHNIWHKRSDLDPANVWLRNCIEDMFA